MNERVAVHEVQSLLKGAENNTSIIVLMHTHNIITKDLTVVLINFKHGVHPKEKWFSDIINKFKPENESSINENENVKRPATMDSMMDDVQMAFHKLFVWLFSKMKQRTKKPPKTLVSNSQLV